MIFVKYSISGLFEDLTRDINSFVTDEYLIGGIKKSIKNNLAYKDKFFKQYFDNEIPNYKIFNDVYCWIDGKPYYSAQDVVKKLGVSRQNISLAKKRKSKTIKKKRIEWGDKDE